ncbi:radical SAM protein [Thermosipho melanesiensis]|uniref:Radical SAM domain protein n=2 Tax=Thermosipho melanesiensis TaxID=46541 RepID=A6LKU4_THEM4|nr:putative DNA modification/repair radical SAM protein [Thermosipho melanesiensis]ABR30545.1 Radical SAM domain protein [Thermosipho melanesiensis BI429]APT73694.1 radical SAM protein [Thermosipho melanesiensis]OOC35633.1 radical SAM protein [Thermosipho melanesiensis]OOC39308.1 radical SAM protein [Thermosipho melanesiensis]OOC39394.1 radical SAM protein [Thermosipho melanesiensis]
MVLERKLKLLTEHAKYDVSCSFGTNERYVYYSKSVKKLRPILKVLFSNACVYDCAYCINRRSNNIERATFTVDELVEITTTLYKKNYVVGLFLSSAVIKDPNYTMKQMLKVVKQLRVKENFPGYIHLKIIPGADEKLVNEAGVFADRISINVEFLRKNDFYLLTPEKKPEDIQKPLSIAAEKYEEYFHQRRKYKIQPFSPDGQTTQLIVGISKQSDKKILSFASKLYRNYKLKRVYYSGYVAINKDKRLPNTSESIMREHRLYQADFLLRFYNFTLDEIFEDSENLDLNLDPKLRWALNHPEFFPIDISKASFDELIRIPGVGINKAKKIILLRKEGRLSFETLRKIGVFINNDFIVLKGKRVSAPLFNF